MESENPLIVQSRSKALMDLLSVTLIALGGFYAVGPFIGTLAAVPFNDWSLLNVLEVISNPGPNAKFVQTMYLVQGVTTLVAFIIIPLVYLIKVRKRSVDEIFGASFPSPGMALITTLLVIVFMGFNSFFIDLNANISFPESLKGFESILKQLHESYETVAKYLTTFDEGYEIWAALLVIAILPAIGEELIFRGWIQPNFITLTGNAHVGIWATAIFFSLFHLDFYGLIPRALLGAVFGYLFYWSKSLYYPIIAHFVNNGFTVFMLYLYKRGAINVDIESTEAVSYPYVIGSFILVIVILFNFYNRFKAKDQTSA